MRVDFALVAYCPRCRCCEPTVAELPASALGAPLPRLQRRGQGYNFAWFGIEGSRYLRRTWLHPPVQFFQPLSHFHSVLITSTILTVRMMDFQQGQQGASQFHRHLAENSVHFDHTGRCVQGGELTFEEAASHYPTRCGYRFQKICLHFRCPANFSCVSSA
jgi:hypothetical protein